jgi:hypothetical protein
MIWRAAVAVDGGRDSDDENDENGRNSEGSDRNGADRVDNRNRQ